MADDSTHASGGICAGAGDDRGADCKDTETAEDHPGACTGRNGADATDGQPAAFARDDGTHAAPLQRLAGSGTYSDDQRRGESRQAEATQAQGATEEGFAGAADDAGVPTSAARTVTPGTAPNTAAAASGLARRGLLAVCVVLAACLVATLDRPAAAATREQPIPALAYYYIWYNPTSWRRAKKDYPLLGRYSSNERSVMRQHVRWAQHAGLQGFIVSWKSTPTLDGRLERLVEIADASHFKLAIIYEGLDFERRPLSTGRVLADLNLFAQRYSREPAFKIFGKPLVIWSGTWKYTAAQVASVTSKVRSRLLVLASEKNTQGYERLARAVDGDAYYWSSVDPKVYPGYPSKLVEMGNAIHARRGLWIAPAAVGFDARLIGGKRVVDRRNGETLRLEMNGAIASSPDAVGIISWNEFSENSEIEPSVKYGTRYLRVLAALRGGRSPSIEGFDSDAVAAHGSSTGRTLVLAAASAVVLALLIVSAARRRRLAQRTRVS